MPRRILNWDVLATQWAVEQLREPFVWGRTDCASLVRGMLAVMYGEEIVAPERLRYDSLLEARRVAAQCGGVRGVLLELGAWPLGLLLEANTGDIMIAGPWESEPFDSVMPVITDKFLLTQPGQLIEAVPLTAAPPETVVYRLPYAW